MNNKNNDFRNIRTFYDLSQEQYADLLGVTQGYITLIESGQRRYTEDLRERVMKALQLTPEQLGYVLAIKEGYDAARTALAKGNS